MQLLICPTIAYLGNLLLFRPPPLPLPDPPTDLHHPTKLTDSVISIKYKQPTDLHANSGHSVKFFVMMSGVTKIRLDVMGHDGTAKTRNDHMLATGRQPVCKPLRLSS